jgi:uncharacterized protein YunC (DUF1805 family)
MIPIPERKKIVVMEEAWGKVITMNSTSQLSGDETGQIVIAGSHAANNVARHAAECLPFGLILNDGGKGKDGAAIAGLATMNGLGILAAAVDSMTARIGEGDDTYRTGIISVVNETAQRAGVRVGMTCAEAARVMLEAKKTAQSHHDAEVVYEGKEGRIILVDSVSQLNESHRGTLVVGGSHCAHTTLYRTAKLNLRGIFQNDAGKGKENQGISGLPLYDQIGVPAAAVDCMTAKIGDARDTWESGKLSVVNETAKKIGLNVGMTVQEAAWKILRPEKYQ